VKQLGVAGPWLSIAWVALASLASADRASAPQDEVAAADIKRYVACPIYRDVDVGRKSSCWLATEAASGIRYDIGESPVKPQLGREVLVEGVVAKDADVCGGPVLNPVRVSVLDTTCARVMLPAEAYAGRRFVLPEVLPPRHVRRPAPAPPYEPREFTIYFEWNSDFLRYQHAEIAIDKALTYIKASRAKQIVVTGFADGDGFVFPQGRLVEPLSLARARAAMVAEALQRLGVPKASIALRFHARGKPDALARTGLLGPSKRRATIGVTPAE
jgi:outer membrane protein OmpA-like peptidoglycan-associated protein